MRKTWIVTAMIVAGACGWFGRNAISDVPPPEKAPPTDRPPPSDMEKALIELGTPGPMHHWLAAAEGTWSVAVTAHGPDGKPEQSQSTAAIKMILDGRFQEQRYTGNIGGKPYEGYGLLGYDKLKHEFVLYWFDSMGTVPSVSRGQRSSDGKMLTLTGTWDMPGTSMPFKQVWTFKSEKEFTFVMTMTMEGQEVPVMESTYTKK